MYIYVYIYLYICILSVRDYKAQAVNIFDSVRYGSLICWKFIVATGHPPNFNFIKAIILQAELSIDEYTYICIFIFIYSFYFPTNIYILKPIFGISKCLRNAGSEQNNNK